MTAARPTSSVPPSPPASSKLPCGLISGSWDPPTLDLEYLAARYPQVIVATADGYGAPFWSTRDRSEPSVDLFRSGRVEIRTPLLTSDVEVLRDGVAEGGIVIGQQGRIGCIEYVAVTQVPALGERYVMFLDDESQIWVIWPVTGGVAQTQFDGLIGVSDLAHRLEHPEDSQGP